MPLYIIGHLTNDEELISHIEILAVTDNDQEKLLEGRRVAEKKKNGELQYMQDLLRIVNIG